MNNFFRFQSIFHVQQDDGGAPIIFDSGASTSISPFVSDFIDGTLDCSPSAIDSSQILGINASTAVKGVRKIKLIVYTDEGYKRELITTAFFVPEATSTTFRARRRRTHSGTSSQHRQTQQYRRPGQVSPPAQVPWGSQRRIQPCPPLLVSLPLQYPLHSQKA